MTRTYSDLVVLGTLGVVAIAAATIGFFLGSSPYPKERGEVTIVLQEAGQPCHALDPEQLRSQTKKSVKWHIKNTCTTAQWVRIDSFREKNFDGNGSEGPPEEILNPASLQKGPVPGGQTTVDSAYDVSATIKKEKDAHFDKALSYKYVISIGPNGTDWPTRLDPDIEIWP